MLVFLVELRMV